MHLVRPLLAVALAGAAALVGTPASAQGVSYADCDAVRAAGKAPLFEGQPGYRPGLDGDEDGVACEPSGWTAPRPTTPRTTTPRTTTPRTTTPAPPATTIPVELPTAPGGTTGTSTATGTTTSSSTSTTPDRPEPGSGDTTRTKPPERPGVGSGLYRVGGELRAGVYRTVGDGPNHCTWYRLRGADGDFRSIVAVDVFRGPGYVEVRRGDRFVKFGGGCTWRWAGPGDRGGSDDGDDSRDDRDRKDRDRSDDRDGSDGRDRSDGRDGSDGDGNGGRSGSGGSGSGSTPGVYTQVAASAVPVGGIETGA